MYALTFLCSLRTPHLGKSSGVTPESRGEKITSPPATRSIIAGAHGFE